MFIDNKTIIFWGTKPPTGTLPLDPAGSALPPDLIPGQTHSPRTPRV